MVTGYQRCVKSVEIRSFFWSVFSRIRTEYGPEKTPYLDNLHAVQPRVNIVSDVGSILFVSVITSITFPHQSQVSFL